MAASFTYDPQSGQAPLIVSFTDTSTAPASGNVTLLAHFIGSNGSTTFVDSSDYNRTMSVGSGSPTISTDQFINPPSSLFCSDIQANAGSVKVDTVSDGGFIFPGDFTIECYAYHLPAAWSTYGTIMRRDFNTQGAYWLFRKGPDDHFHFDCNNPISGGFSLTSGEFVSDWDNMWVHLAVVRAGSTIKMYVDGQMTATGIYTGIVGGVTPTTDDGNMNISQPSGGEQWTGYLGEIRINKGYAYYKTTFTPPAPPLSASSITVTGWNWDFGDGGSSATQNPNHEYSTVGTYYPVLTALYSDNSQSSTQPIFPVTATGVPQVSFTASPSYGAVPLSVGFTNTSGGFNNPSYLWHFGDGTTSTLSDPTHEYLAGGRYPVYLTVTDNNEVYESDVQYVAGRSEDPATSYFAMSKYNGLQYKDDDGKPVLGALLYSYASGTFAQQHTHEGGDGGWNTNPLMTTSNGTFDEKICIPSGVSYRLVLTKPDGTTVLSQEDNVVNGQIIAGDHIYITDTGTAYPAKPPIGMGTVTVNCVFPDPLKGHGETYIWWVKSTYPLMTNGAENNSLLAVRKLPVAVPRNPVATFQEDGSLLFNQGGSYTISVTWELDPGPDLQFPEFATVFGNHISGPTNYTPRNKSYGTRYSAIAGDNGISQKTTWSDTWTVSVNEGDYVYIDTYAQSTTAPTDLNYRGIIQLNRIGDSYVGAVPPIPPTASFTAVPSIGNIPMTVQFTDTSTEYPTEWLWWFGDGFGPESYSTDRNPMHTYTTPHQTPLQVSLRATNQFGSHTGWGEVTVWDGPEWGIPPVPSFTVSPASGTGQAPLTVQFTDTSYGLPTGWNWDFGDGSEWSYGVQNPTHTYATGGTYNVSLYAFNIWGAGPAPATQPYTVNAAPPPPVTMYHLQFMDDTGTYLPIVVSTPEVFPAPGYGPPVAYSALQDLVSQLAGFNWPRNGGSPMAYFNVPPEPDSTNNVLFSGRNYFFQDDQYSYGRWLYLRWTTTP